MDLDPRVRAPLGKSRAASKPRAQRSVRTILGRIVDGFAWPLRASQYVDLINPLWTAHALQARVEAVEEETADTRTLLLRPGRRWRTHRPGQYVRIGVAIDGRHYWRTYSISSAPQRPDGCIAITVKAVEGGRVSPHLVHSLRPGSYLSLGLPQGDFVLRESAPARLLFISAGSGITPVMSMLRGLAAQGRMPDVVHFHYAPTAADVIFAEEIAQLADRHSLYHPHLFYTRTACEGRKPHFSASRLNGLCPDWQERECYACGPQSLLQAVEACWQGAGLTDRLHIERFHAALAEPPNDAAGGRVRFSRSRHEAIADARTSLLRVAEQAGLNPPHGCRMGICHTCTATMLSGCVRDLRTNQLIEEPGSAVQICVSAAAGNVELEL